jgi:hypothetical protein
LPEITGAEAYYRDGLYTMTDTPIFTLFYRNLDQALLAHASDQYGYNYSKDRQIVHADTYIEALRLYNLYEFGGRVLMLTGGTYDVRRNELKGNFVEVTQLDRLPAWLWENGDVIIWEDGSRILL